MADLPPRLDSPLVRVLRLSRFNGMSVAIIAGLGTTASLLMGDFLGTGIGLLAVAAGLMELHGRGLVMRDDGRGFTWLAGSQCWLVAVITGYALARIETFDSETALHLLPPESLRSLNQLGIDPHDFVRKVSTTSGIVIIAATLLYQGSMWRFYRRAAKVLEQEHDAES